MISWFRYVYLGWVFSWSQELSDVAWKLINRKQLTVPEQTADRESEGESGSKSVTDRDQ